MCLSVTMQLQITLIFGLLMCTTAQGTDWSYAVTALQQELREIKDLLILLTNASVLSDRPEWRKRYPVYMEESSRGYNQMSKHEAERACEESGGYLANFNQLQSAFDAGMDWCHCGWIAEGYAVYPIQFPRQGCGIQERPGLRKCKWEGTWNAWCIQSGDNN